MAGRTILSLCCGTYCGGRSDCRARHPAGEAGMIWAYVAFAAAAGAMLPLQAGINARLAHLVGSPLWAAAVSGGGAHGRIGAFHRRDAARRTAYRGPG